MDDLGGILFYIIAAVIGLATTLGRKKKKAASRTTAANMEVFDNKPVPDTEGKQPGYIDELVAEDDFWINSEEKKSEVYSFDDDLEGEYVEPLAEQFKSEGEPQLSKIIKEKVEETVDEVDEGEEDIVSGFDLRKAVIYSEILNRKDY